MRSLLPLCLLVLLVLACTTIRKDSPSSLATAAPEPPPKVAAEVIAVPAPIQDVQAPALSAPLPSGAVDAPVARTPVKVAVPARPEVRYRYPLYRGAEWYERVPESGFFSAREAPLSTFAIDADTASCAHVRRFIGEGAMPPADAVRIEELVDYFDYDFRPPADGNAFAVHAEVAQCPWDRTHRLALVGIKARMNGR